MLYMLPKIHKAGNPGRPIISACNCPTSNISAYLDSVMAPLVRQLSSYVKDTHHAPPHRVLSKMAATKANTRFSCRRKTPMPTEKLQRLQVGYTHLDNPLPYSIKLDSTQPNSKTLFLLFLFHYSSTLLDPPQLYFFILHYPPLKSSSTQLNPTLKHFFFFSFFITARLHLTHLHFTSSYSITLHSTPALLNSTQL